MVTYRTLRDIVKDEDGSRGHVRHLIPLYQDRPIIHHALIVDSVIIRRQTRQRVALQARDDAHGVARCEDHWHAS